MQTIHTLKQTLSYRRAEQRIHQTELENAVLDAGGTATSAVIGGYIRETEIIPGINCQSRGRDVEAYAKDPIEIGGFIGGLVVFANAAYLGFGAHQEASLGTSLDEQSHRKTIFKEHRNINVVFCK